MGLIERLLWSRALTTRTQRRQQNGMDHSLIKNTKNRTERNVDTTGKEWNDLAEGPCSRTEKTIYKKLERSQPYYQPLVGG